MHSFRSLISFLLLLIFSVSSSLLLAYRRPPLADFHFLRGPDLPAGCILPISPEETKIQNPAYLSDKEKKEALSYFFENQLEGAEIDEIYSGFYVGKGWEKGKDNAVGFSLFTFTSPESFAKAEKILRNGLKKADKSFAKDLHLDSSQTVLALIRYDRQSGPGENVRECFESLKKEIGAVLHKEDKEKVKQ